MKTWRLTYQEKPDPHRNRPLLRTSEVIDAPNILAAITHGDCQSKQLDFILVQVDEIPVIPA